MKFLKSCLGCGAQVDQDASACFACGRRRPATRGPLKAIIWALVVVAALVVFGLASCGSVSPASMAEATGGAGGSDGGRLGSGPAGASGAGSSAGTDGAAGATAHCPAGFHAVANPDGGVLLCLQSGSGGSTGTGNATGTGNSSGAGGSGGASGATGGEAGQCGSCAVDEICWHGMCACQPANAGTGNVSGGPCSNCHWSAHYCPGACLPVGVDPSCD